MHKQHSGFSLIENLVAISILMLIVLGTLASSAISKAVEKNALSRSASLRAVNLATGPLFAASSASALIAMLKTFPKSVYLTETHETYVVNLVALTDYSGAAMSLSSVPATSGVAFATFNTAYNEKYVGYNNAVSVTPTYLFHY